MALQRIMSILRPEAIRLHILLTATHLSTLRPFSCGNDQSSPLAMPTPCMRKEVGIYEAKCEASGG
jgi:hypothetical protein